MLHLRHSRRTAGVRVLRSLEDSFGWSGSSERVASPIGTRQLEDGSIILTEPPRTFKEAVDGFTTFLTEHGFSSDIRWVFREDVAMHRSSLWIRSPLPSSNGNFAQKLFYIGTHRGLGMRLSCLAMMDDASACYVSVPEDQEDAEYMMVSGGFQYSCPNHPTPARTMKSGLLWSVRKWRGDKWLAYLPVRRELGMTQVPIEILPKTEPKLLFVVEDFFTIKGRGITLLPGVRLDEHGPFANEEIIFKVGDKIELRRPDGTVLKTKIAGVHLPSFKRTEGDPPEEHRYLWINFARQLERSDVPDGTEVWIADH